ncbi:hypothetical protein IQ274_28485 [Nostoc sp. LEGE 12447]|uniref:hypothetical protein n=1 Tax=Nostoc sp. LEGE 12447 TaxID=1828640 RepID=UPI0018836D1E|nr:hypothetical protein [Nostoc sp. LEGE 12447]MBE9002034.1 hypothetical protein [Nostoc sp. LEGE 12447]
MDCITCPVNLYIYLITVSGRNEKQAFWDECSPNYHIIKQNKRKSLLRKSLLLHEATRAVDSGYNWHSILMDLQLGIVVKPGLYLMPASF